MGGDVVALLRQALDMGLVDDGVFPGDVGPDLAAAPVEGFVDHDGLRHAAGVVAAVEGKILARAAGAVGEMRIAPHQPARRAAWHRDRAAACWRLKRWPRSGRVGPIDAIAIELAGRDVVEIAVPDVLGSLGQLDALELAAALAVEQAQLDLLRVGGEQRKVGAPAVPACAEA